MPRLTSSLLTHSLGSLALHLSLCHRRCRHLYVGVSLAISSKPVNDLSLGKGLSVRGVLTVVAEAEAGPVRRHLRT